MTPLFEFGAFAGRLGGAVTNVMGGLAAILLLGVTVLIGLRLRRRGLHVGGCFAFGFRQRLGVAFGIGLDLFLGFAVGLELVGAVVLGGGLRAVRRGLLLSRLQREQRVDLRRGARGGFVGRRRIGSG